MEMPTICSPCAPYFFWKSTSHGISILHGSHHVAQKFTTTAFPFRSESFRVLPFPSSTFRSKSGAGLPLNRSSSPLALATWFGCDVNDLPKNKSPVTTTITTPTKITLFFTFNTSHGKAVEEAQPACQPSEMAGQDQSSNRDQENSADYLHSIQMTAKPAVKNQEPVY